MAATIPLFRLGLRNSFSSPLRTHMLPSRHSHLSSSTRSSVLHQFLKQRSSTLRLFSTISGRQNPRPYPHRQFNHQRRDPSFLGFLDRIPQNTVFWGIITINGVVFAMWFMASQRLVRFSNHTYFLTSLIGYGRNNNAIHRHTDG